MKNSKVSVFYPSIRIGKKSVGLLTEINLVNKIKENNQTIVKFASRFVNLYATDL